MAYKAIVFFKDLKDGSHAYNPGDVYPREGVQVSAERIEELASGNNRRGIPVIEEVKEEPKEKPKTEKKAEENPEKKTETKSESKPKKKGGKKKNAD